ncbi:MAG: dynamin family protein [Acutalibacteraceae bacterium]
MNMENFLKLTGEINEGLKAGKGIVDSSLLESFEERQKNLTENIEDIQKKERTLKIGIVGAVKAGKSSFLNALLFDGEDILPKAPTPMTAALTKIVYSEKPFAQIYFYSKEEWSYIESKYKECKNEIDKQYKKELEECRKAVAFGASNVTYPSFESVEEKCKNSMSVEQVSCYELCKMLKDQCNVSQVLAKRTENIEGTDGFSTNLQDYVGADGIYTPLVKHTVLGLKNPFLKGLEIVDTPGLNDPIISRSQTTQKYLGQCDVTFILSNISQFLTSEDIRLINDLIPSEGISKTVIVASQLDNGILDIRHEKDFVTALKKTVKTAKNSADSKKINNRFVESAINNYGLLCTSSMFYSMAKKNELGISYNKEENHIHEELNKRFKDTVNWDTDSLMDYSGFSEVRNRVLVSIRNDKEEIIANRIKDHASMQKTNFLGLLENIYIDAENVRNDINKYDYAQLQEKKKRLITYVDSIRRAINNAFRTSADSTEKKMQKIIYEIETEAFVHDDLEYGTKQMSETYRIKTGWIKKTPVIKKWNEKTAKVVDVENNIREYCTEIHKIMIDTFEKLIDLDELKSKVKGTVLNAFEEDDNFDPEEISMTLDELLGGLTVPKLELDVNSYLTSLAEKIPGCQGGEIVGDNKVAKLESAQSEVLSQISADVKKQMERKAGNIAEKMNLCAATFADEMQNKLSGSIDRVSAMLSDKEANLAKINDFINIVSNAKEQLYKADIEI